MSKLIWSVLLFAACAETPAPTPAPEPAPAPAPVEAPKAEPKNVALFGALPDVAAPADDAAKAKIELGKALYYDARLSRSQTISCNSCHKLDGFGVDGNPTSPGHKGQLGGRNSPTTLNAYLHATQFWDGRAKDVEEQAKGPVTNPVEMAMKDGESVTKLLGTIPGYEPMFKAAFPADAAPVTFDNAALAIAAFERTLSTPGAFDKYMKGDATALTEAQVKGMDTFVEVGCNACHSGPLLGGQTFMKLGAVVPYETKDMGRFEVTKNEADKMMFKVPSLRNIAKTGPYFHDGSIATLDDAVLKMGKHQLGKDLTPEQVAAIKTFLEALTGEVPASVAMPTLPESGPKTPKGDAS